MNKSPDELDRLLHQWARHNEASPQRLEHLRERLAQNAEVVSAPSVPRRSWSMFAAGGIAASLLALSVMIALWPSLQNRPAPAAALPSEVAPIPESHLLALFAEMERVFDNRVAWVAETNHEVLLGLEQAARSTPADRRVAVRVVVLQRESPSDPWRAVWKGDVATRSEELVSVASERDGARLDLWTHVLPDGAVTVDFELAGLVSQSKAWRSSSVQQPQTPTAVLSVQQRDSEFQVWQNATLLPEETL
jgi:hypothetical protein